jgi:SpoIID/LytB domain
MHVRHSGKTLPKHVHKKTADTGSGIASPVSQATSGPGTNDSLQKTGPLKLSSGPSYYVPSRFLRVALRQNAKRAQFSSSGQVDISSGGTFHGSERGTIAVEMAGSGDKISGESQNGGKWECALPCTLLSKNELNIIQYDGSWYRGSMFLVAAQRGSFIVVNYVNVEDYLRGVVPLEIGHCKPDEVEAVKAQAVAARTYTYKKVLEKQGMDFDLLPTISDQAYGGVGAENSVCNEAINNTVDQVIVCRDSLIYAYYHSTCGGKTANIEDVWENKQPLSYLRSIDDADEKGTAFCAISGSFLWEESWSFPHLSTIVNRYSRETFPQRPAAGSIIAITIDSRFACGRTHECTIKTSAGSYRYGGDKIRFILRRDQNGFPVLRSALITDVSKTSGSMVFKGRGYGHGVGMCQFGAIGRARAGQSYEQILKTYYTGVELKKIGILKQ